ncbi:MAG TPA: stage II sporulation protein E, partial [Firmicutes bacterium]|nr:stage II sporulation protein E [Bacillota bacterium]
MRQPSGADSRRKTTFPWTPRRLNVVAAAGGAAILPALRRGFSLPRLRLAIQVPLAFLPFLLGAGFLLGRVSLLHYLYPFGLAFTGAFAGAGAPWETLVAGLGAAAGLASTGAGLVFGYLPALLLLWSVAWRSQETPPAKPGGRGARQKTASAARETALIWTASVVAVATALGRIGWDAWVQRSVWDVGPLLLEAVGAGLLAALFREGLGAAGSLKDRRRMGREEVAGAALLATLLVAGLQGFGVWAVSLQDAATRWLVLAAAWGAGAGGGAVAGTVTGCLGMLLGSVPPYQVGAYALAGTLAGLVREYGKPALVAGFASGVLILSHLIPGAEELTGTLLASGLAMLAFSVTPLSVAAWFGSGWPAVAKTSDACQRAEADRLQEAFARRLQDFSQVFKELARIFHCAPSLGEGGERPELPRLMEAVAERACVSCSEATECWKERFYLTYRDVTELMTRAETLGRATLLDVPEGLRRCPQVHKIVSAVNQLLELNKVNSVWEKKITESKQLVYGQLNGVAELMENLAREARLGTDGACRERQEEVAAVLGRYRIPVVDVIATSLGDDRVALEIRRRPCEGREECRRVIPELLTQAIGPSYSLYEAECGRTASCGRCTLHYLPERAYDLIVRVAKCAGNDGPICGDSHAVIDLPGGKTAVVLSDGMGIGPEAALESSAAIDVLAQLMKAGFGREFAVRTVNSILLLRSPQDSFATVDLMLADLYTGQAEFVKIGACPSYIVRGGEVLVVERPSLPAGILSAIDVEVKERLLRPGDLIVMVTDGLFGTDPERVAAETFDWIPEALLKYAENEPSTLAQRLLAQARELCGDRAGDDMTVLVSQVRRRAD